DNYLVDKATERYYIELEDYYQVFIKKLAYVHVKKHGLEGYNAIEEKMNLYRKMIIDFEKGVLERKKEMMFTLIEKCQHYECTKELYNLLERKHKIIFIKDFLNSYGLFEKFKSNRIFRETIEHTYIKEYTKINDILILDQELKSIRSAFYSNNSSNLNDCLAEIPKLDWKSIISYLDSTM
ncbi:MAG: hypothetical protein R3321_08405, partial [Nitrososphaeraceae archaeon]|nr:hypothetical protein [Nitrososphaeraceae archaeon]